MEFCESVQRIREIKSRSEKNQDLDSMMIVGLANNYLRDIYRWMKNPPSNHSKKVTTKELWLLAFQAGSEAEKELAEICRKFLQSVN